MGAVEAEPNTKTSNPEKNVDVELSTTKQQRHATSKVEAAIHLFKGSVGAGLFAMGDGYRNGGLVGASIMLPIIGIICVHCDQLLIDASVLVVQKTPGAVFFDYPETVEKSFEYGPMPLRKLSKFMKLVTETFLCVTQFGFCSVYFVFVTENIHQILAQNGIHISQGLVMTATLVPVMLPSLMTNLKYIKSVSMFANVALLTGLIATLAISMKDGLPAPSTRHMITNPSQMSLFFGTALFAYEGIGLILPLRNSMKNPDSFSSRFGVLNVTMLIITALFMFTGFVTYVKYGEAVEGSITLNLNPEDVISQFVKVIAALGVFFGYPIQFYVMVKIIWPSMKQSSDCCQKYPITTQVILRFIMVLFTFIVALLVPQLGVFISLIGALCSTTLAFLIPAVIDFIVRAQIPKGLNTWVYLKNTIIILISVLGIVTGTYESIIEIISAFQL